MVAEKGDDNVTVNPDEVLAPGETEEKAEDENSDYISQPAKVMRIGSMVKSLLEEARSAPLDEAGRTRLREIYETSIRELSGALSPDLGEELSRMAIPFSANVPSESELRIAQAQLVDGWRVSFTGFRLHCSPNRPPRRRNWKRCAIAPFRRVRAINAPAPTSRGIACSPVRGD
jgi:hypothetical protein